MTLKRTYHIFVAAFLSCFLLWNNGYAQKKRNNDPERKRREVEFLLTEAMRYHINDDYAKAVAEYTKALEMDPQNALINFKMAEIYAEEENASKALLHISTAVKSDPGNKFYWVFKANLETAIGDFSAAIASYESMRKNSSEYEEYLLEMAAVYYYAGKLDEALKIYNEAEAYYGVYEQIVFQKQNILLKKNKLKEAIAEGVKLVEYFPGEAEYVEALVNIMMSNGKAKEALSMIEQYMQDFGDDAKLEFLAAGIHRQVGQIEKSKPYLISAYNSSRIDINEKLNLFTRLMQTASDNSDWAFLKDLGVVLATTHPEEANAQAMNGDLLYSMGEKEGARNYYRLAVELDKTNLQLWQNLLSIEVDYKNYAEVIVLSEEALEYFPNQAVLYLFNGTAQLINKNYQEAVFSLEQGLRLSKDDLGMQNTFQAQLGDAYNALKQYAKSEQAYEAALDFDPNNAHVLNNYSYFLALRKEKLQKAKLMSAKLIKAHPNSPTYLDTHAWVLYNLGEYEEAKKHLQKAIQKASSCVIFEHYGDVLYRLGDSDGAVQQWEKATTMGNCSDKIERKIKDKKLYE